MRYIIIVIISFCFLNGFSQQNNYALRKDELQSVKKMNEYVNKYANSLNTYSCNDCKELPHFFYNYNLDRDNKIGWLGLHIATSLRKQIIEKINNVQLLEAVLKNKDKSLRKRTKIPKKQYMGDIIIPFQEYSTYELAKFRLQELLNETNMGKRASNYPY